MSRQAVEAFIHAVFRDGQWAAFVADPEGVLDRFALGPEERAALKARDYGALYRMGVHPMLVLFYGQINRTPMPEYLAAIGASPERVEEFRRFAGPPPADATGN